MNFKLLLALSLVFLFLSFYFTMLSISYRRITQNMLNNLRKTYPESYYYIDKNMDQVDDILNTMLILDYFSNICLSVCLALVGLDLWDMGGLVLGVFLAGILILLFGEGLPTRLAQAKQEEIVVNHSRLIYYLRIVLSPILFLVDKGNALLFAPFDQEEDQEEDLSLDLLTDSLYMTQEEEVLDQDQVDIIENVIDFGQLYAKDVMTPRTDIIAFDVEASWEEIRSTIAEEGFSRYPVYEDDLDDVLGILHVKDLFIEDLDKVDLRSILRPAYFTFEYQHVSSLFRQIRYEKRSLALVYDEYGGLEGMISIEDLLEEIVGEITDEYDEDEVDEIIQVNSHEFILEGSASLADFSRLIDRDLESEEFDSVGGFIIEKIDRFPARGEVIQLDDLTFFIEETSKNRVERIRCQVNE